MHFRKFGTSLVSLCRTFLFSQINLQDGSAVDRIGAVGAFLLRNDGVGQTAGLGSYIKVEKGIEPYPQGVRNLGKTAMILVPEGLCPSCCCHIVGKTIWRTRGISVSVFTDFD